ncbi:MAG: hypothetical protein IJY93_08885 [Clostridia bacterium]|nr:hypothetical protein [Clostridia bacterium]
MKYEVNGASITLIEDEVLVAGSVKVHFAEFTFDESWDGYTAKVAVFKMDEIEREIQIVDGKCEIPWEVLSERGTMQAGVYGATGEVRRPTLWSTPKTVQPGAASCEKSREPTPDKWQQVLATIEQAEYAVTPRISDSGNWFVGDKDTGIKARGDDGDDYILTEADKAEIVQTVLAGLPDGDEVSY